MKAGTSNFASFQPAVQQGGALAQACKADAGFDPRDARPVRLTPRELEVLALLCEGLPNKLISRRLDISSATVKCHISRILSELGVSSRLQAVVSAARCGLVSEPGVAGPDDNVAPMRNAPVHSGLQGSVRSGIMAATL
jgi:DNA-binding NarL/FixJ family response regulator